MYEEYEQRRVPTNWFRDTLTDIGEQMSLPGMVLGAFLLLAVVTGLGWLVVTIVAAL